MTTTDSLGVDIQFGDVVRVIAWGWNVPSKDCGLVFQVTGFTAKGNVKHTSCVGYGEPVKGCLLAVLRRDGKPGNEGNR